MNLRSFKALLLSATIAAMVTSILTSVTNTGMAGIYGFGFLSLIGLCLYLAWPEIRSSQASGKAARRERKA
jgi:hypothetical protein